MNNDTVYVCTLCGSDEISELFSEDVVVKRGYSPMAIDVEFCGGCDNGNTHERIPIEKARGLPNFKEK